MKRSATAPAVGWLAGLALLFACNHKDTKPAAPAAVSGASCGELECKYYDSAAAAFLDATSGNPLVLAIGEAHAPKGATVPSAAKRFADELLPLLAGRASDLLMELMMPPSGCGEAAAEVKGQQEAVTSHQAETDQNEYVAMGQRARGLRIVPDMLRPTCADLDAIRASDDPIETSLETIARLCEAQGERLVARDERSDVDRGRMVILYGGAIHNDLTPPPGFERWSYATKLEPRVGGQLVAIDLIVPEFVEGQDADASKSAADPLGLLAFWPVYREASKRPGAASKAMLLRTGTKSFVLVFPRHDGR